MNPVLPSAGSYVMAVSGGVDSMALLHALHVKNAALGVPWKLVVAHFDHGIRDDSAEDRRLVQITARELGLSFAYYEGNLGSGVSEATARTARYDFLEQVRAASGARAIVTAHHQDDVLETAIINLLRGSGRKGLTALDSRPGLERPLLVIPKNDILTYAHAQGLRWREDSTNQDQDYLRNYVRHRIIPRFDEPARVRLRQLINDLRATNQELDTLLVNQLHLQSVGGQLDRHYFNQLPHAAAREVMAAWLRAHGVRQFDSRGLERLVVAAKVVRPGKIFDVSQGVQLQVGNERLALVRPER